MKTFVIREGSRYTLEQETPTRLLVTSAVADRDISFDESELAVVNTVTRVLTFHVGNRNYYVSKDNVTVLS